MQREPAIPASMWSFLRDIFLCAITTKRFCISGMSSVFFYLILKKDLTFVLTHFMVGFICFSERPLQMIKNPFYFMLKSLFPFLRF